MVYAAEPSPKGDRQDCRDRLRLDALAGLGFDVYSCDDKHTHEQGLPGKHLQANFSDASRFKKDFVERWGEGRRFRTLILDYFFSPPSWAEERYKSERVLC